jgi:hypothetical protein
MKSKVGRKHNCIPFLMELKLEADWLMLKESSPLKQLGQMEPNLEGTM